jgi:hypothetical protein
MKIHMTETVLMVTIHKAITNMQYPNLSQSCNGPNSKLRSNHISSSGSIVPRIHRRTQRSIIPTTSRKMSRISIIPRRRLRRNTSVQRSAAATPIRLSQRLHAIQSPVPSSPRSGRRLGNIFSNILVFCARRADQKTHGSRYAVDQIVWVQGIEHCSPKRQATHAGLVRVLG